MDAVESLRPDTEDLWKFAVTHLSDEDRAYLDIDCPDRQQIVAKSLELTNDAKKRCEEKAWRFKRKSGEVVIARDVFAKVARWIEHFKAVGDTIVQYDPAHAALPWAGVRFVLQVCVNYFETHDFLLETIPLIAEQICRCALIEKLLISPLAMAEELKRALVKLYTSILTYQARVKAYFQKPTIGQILQSLKKISIKFEAAFQAILVAQTNVERCFQMASVQEQLDRLDQLKNAFFKFEKPIERWSDKLAKITDELDRSKRKEILQWISDEPYLQYHKREHENFLEGTGEWLLSNTIFKKWKKESASSILWLHGIPGSGKSKITSLVIQNAREAFRKQQAPSPAFFYCSRNPAEPGRSDPEKILASIVRQLSSIGPGKPILQPAIAVYESHEEEGFAANSLQLQDSSKLLLQLLENYPMATIIIDALDECRADTRRKLLECLEHILRESSTLVKIFVSSRDDQDIVCKLQNYADLELSSHLNSSDIAYFVRSEADSLIAKKDLLRFSQKKDELREKIIEVVSNGADGMFRWASLQLQALCDLKSDGAILERLGRLPPTLEELYQELVDKIEAYSAETDRRYAANALAWLLCGRRRLSSKEFLAAVSTSPSLLSTSLTKDQVLDLCCNLIVFDSTLKGFRFAHLSVREFLETKEAYANTTINSIAAQCCLTALMPCGKADISKHGVAEDYSIEDCQISCLHLYASSYWAPHCQEAADKRRHGRLSTLLETFLLNTAPNSPFSEWNGQIQTICRRMYPVDYRLRKKLRDCESADPSSLFVASAFDFTEIMEIHSTQGAGLESRRSTNYRGDTCTVIAASNGSCNVLLALLCAEEFEVTRGMVEAAAGNQWGGKGVMALLLEKRGDEVQITEDVVTAAAGNDQSGKEVTALLLEQRGDEVQITEDVVKAAAGNDQSGKEIMALLLEKRGDEVQITENVVKAAAGNKWGGKGVMALLFEQRGDEVRITENVVKAAAGNDQSGKEVTALLLEQRGDEVQITEDVVKAAARNRWGGKGVMALLFEQRGDEVRITENVVKAAAGNDQSGKEVTALLLEQRGDEVQITEDVVKAAAGNKWGGKGVMALLFEKRGDEVQITEDVVTAAARNRWGGKGVMSLLLERRGDEFRITENVVKAVAGNEWSGKGVMSLLLERRGDEFRITENVVKAAAGNKESGKGVMSLLLERRGDEFRITEDVVKAAAGNKESGKGVMSLLLEKRGNEVRITEDVVKAAAGNEESGKNVMSLLLTERREDVVCSLTEAVFFAAASSGQHGVLDLLSPFNGHLIRSDGLFNIATFHNASKSGDLETITKLLHQGISPDLKDTLGRTPFWLAAYSGHQNILQLLVHRSDIDINSKAISGRPPIFWPSANGKEAIVALLMGAGADPNIQDNNLETAISMARKYGHSRVVQILEQSGTYPGGRAIL